MTKLKSWVPVPKDSDFTIHNLPFGIFSTRKRNKRVGVAIGDQILDLGRVADLKLLKKLGVKRKHVYTSSLNSFIGLGKAKTTKVREKIQEWLCDKNSKLKEYDNVFVHRSKATMHLPVKIGDYTDFYSSIEHATNVGKMFRDPANALLPNWKHIPVAYHGRASSIIESGVPIHRPMGQLKPNDKSPVHGPTQRLDFELEMGFIVGQATEVGESIKTKNAEEYIFGMVLLNDWSARDVQKWEYVPLGPFLAKNFASSISPWVVTMEALKPFRVKGPTQTPKVLPYLRTRGDKNYDINLEVSVEPKGGGKSIVCKSNFRYMYWNMAQQLAHHTMNGCNINVGDMMASGTISGKQEDSYGSMLELAWSGSKPLKLNDGTERSFLEDGDTITMRGSAKKGAIRIGFGEVSTEILPPKE